MDFKSGDVRCNSKDDICEVNFTEKVLRSKDCFNEFQRKSFVQRDQKSPTIQRGFCMNVLDLYRSISRNILPPEAFEMPRVNLEPHCVKILAVEPAFSRNFEE